MNFSFSGTPAYIALAVAIVFFVLVAFNPAILGWLLAAVFSTSH